MAKQSTKISPGAKIQLPSQEKETCIANWRKSKKSTIEHIRETVKVIGNLEDKSEERTPNAK